MRRTVLSGIVFILVTGLSAQQVNDGRSYFNKYHKQNIARQVLARKQLFSPAKYGGIDATYYRLDLRFDIDQRMIHGKVMARFKATDDNVSRFHLDMYDSLAVLNIKGPVEQYDHRDDLLNITLNRSLARGQEFEIEIIYSGKPEAPGWTHFRFDSRPDGSPLIWTLSEPYGARRWWPCKDTPADKADSVDILVTVDNDLLCGSNGTLLSVKDNLDGTHTFHWQENYPVTTYLVSLAIGNYRHIQEYYHYSADDSLLLDYYIYPEDEELARQTLAEMPDYLDALSFYFGPYPFLNEKYGFAQFNWGGGMEHQTLTSIGDVSSWYRYVHVHELAHQWFGDAVTCASWQDIWLNEGFASYAEALYAEWAGFNGFPPGSDAYHSYMTTQLFLNDGTIFTSDTSSAWSIFQKVVYDKGSWFLHMLRHVVGKEVFLDILRTYLNDPRWSYGTVNTGNFKSVCESVSGLDLDRFFEQWLYHPFFPVYEYNWAIETRSAKNVNVKVNIKQTQPQTIYIMPIDLRFTFEDGSDSIVTVQNTQANQDFAIRLAKLPLHLEFDPDNWILKEANESSIETFSSHIQFRSIYPNPFRDRIFITTVNWLSEMPNLQIYDVLGRKVRLLTPDHVSQYTYQYSWDGRSESGRRLASGVYFMRPVPQKGYSVANFSTKKIVLLR